MKKKDEKETQINDERKTEDKQKPNKEIKALDLKIRFSKILNNYDKIHVFLNDEEKKNLLLISKGSAKSFLYVIKKINEKQLKENEEALNRFKTKYKEEEYKAEISPFVLNKTEMKVVERLNEEAKYEKIFISEEIPNKDIIFIYRLFLQLINKDNKKINQNDTELWKSAKEILFTNKKEKLGNHLTQLIKEINYSDDNILIINDMCKGKNETLTPKYYNNLCPTTALIFLIIKEIFEYCGILISKKTSLPMQYKKLEFAVKKNKEKEELIKTMIEKANK